MKASVVIPCHNAGLYIAAALRSVADQTLPAHEVIVIDDGSTDDSRKQIQRSGVAVMLLESSHRHAGAARNMGIEAATGDWIAFLDADDLWYPDHLRRAASLLESSDDVAFIAYHHLMEGDDRVSDLPQDLRPKLNRGGGQPALLFPEVCARGFHFGHSTVLLRRDRVMEVGGFDLSQKRRHDFDLWLRMIRDRTWAYDDAPHARYRLDTPGSISKSTVNAEFYFLRALTRNYEGFACPAMDRLIATSARRAMSLAFVDGSAEDFHAARALAWPHLRPSFRWSYRLITLCPPLARAAIRIKRKIVMPAPPRKSAG